MYHLVVGGDLEYLGDSANSIKFREGSVGLDDRQPQWGDPTNRTVVISDQLGTVDQPLFDMMSPCEQVGNGPQSQSSHVDACFVALILAQEVLVF